MRARLWFLTAGMVLVYGALCGCAAPTFEHESLVQISRHKTRDRDGVPEDVRDLFDRINRRRRMIGCGRLAWNERLADLAEAHSKDMARRSFFDHVNPDGLDPFQRMDRAGLRYRAAAENLAMGVTTGAEVYDGWMHSRGHRRNLEDCAYAQIGIGRYGDYWSCEMARLTPESRP